MLCIVPWLCFVFVVCRLLFGLCFWCSCVCSLAWLRVLCCLLCRLVFVGRVVLLVVFVLCLLLGVCCVLGVFVVCSLFFPFRRLIFVV